jgi:PIN domain nuclease of toxin-antitoxin system
MKLLLDTHLVCWDFYEPRKIPEAARQLMIDAEAVFVSSASIWEIAIKVRIGKMQANPRRVVQFMEAAGIQELPVCSKHTVLVADLPLLHTDPFDRLLVAQAISEHFHLLTVDAQLRQYSDLVIQV